MGLKSLSSIAPLAALSWLPRTKIVPKPRERAITSLGLAP